MSRRGLFYRRRFRRGVTLIEIIAGLVILAVLVSSVTVARGRLARQWGDAEKKLRASAAVDQMLAGWVQTDAVPVNGRGVLAGFDDLNWRSFVVQDVKARELGAVVVRVEVMDLTGRVVMGVEVLQHVKVREQGVAG